MKNIIMNDLDEVIENLIYLPVNIPNPPEGCIDGIEEITDSMMKWDEFRSCNLIPLAIDYREKDVIEWVPQFIDRFPKLKSWLEEEVFTKIGFGRTLIIVTDPDEVNSPHIDAAQETFVDLLNHKLRYVLQGNVSDLVFISKDSNTTVPEIDSPYIMNGKWPHMMHNTHNKRKYTLAIGAPWEPSIDDEQYRNLIEDSYSKFNKNYIGSTDSELPVNWKEMFEDYDKNEANHIDAKDFVNNVQKT